MQLSRTSLQIGVMSQINDFAGLGLTEARIGMDITCLFHKLKNKRFKYL
jgi:hypothetical protein